MASCPGKRYHGRDPFKEAKLSRISRLDRSEVTPEMAALYDKAYAQRGNVPNMFRVMAHRPEIFATMQAHFGAVLNTGTLSTKLKELIIVRTSQVNSTPLLPRQPHHSGPQPGMERRPVDALVRLDPSRRLYPGGKGCFAARRDRHPRCPHCQRRAVCRVAQFLFRRRDRGACFAP